MIPLMCDQPLAVPSRCSWVRRTARGWMNLDASPADAASYVSEKPHPFVIIDKR